MSDLLNGPAFKPANGKNPSSLVVLLHGVGADGNDLIGLAPYWAPLLPGTEFLAPDGPEPCDMAPFGRQWFSPPGPLARGDPRRRAGYGADPRRISRRRAQGARPRRRQARAGRILARHHDVALRGPAPRPPLRRHRGLFRRAGRAATAGGGNPLAAPDAAGARRCRSADALRLHGRRAENPRGFGGSGRDLRLPRPRPRHRPGGLGARRRIPARGASGVSEVFSSRRAARRDKA